MIGKIKDIVKGFKAYIALRSSRNIRRRLTTNSNVAISKKARFDNYFSFDIILKDFTLVIKDNVHFKRYCHLSIFPGAELIIHKNVFFNNCCSVNCLEKIEIGENSIFGENVKIYDHNHKYSVITNKLIIERNLYNTAPIIIGDNCWIGSNVTILKGVTIGENVIIGANSLIYKSIPSNTIIKNHVEQIVSTL